MKNPTPRDMRLHVNLPPSQEVGIFADFANVWNTPNTFVIDFISVAQAPGPAINPEGEVAEFDILNGVVSARIRLAPEQIFMLADALHRQGDAWLASTGRTDRPTAWSPENGDANGN